jgi:hypothetical protein
MNDFLIRQVFNIKYTIPYSFIVNAEDISTINKNDNHNLNIEKCS